MDGGENRGPAVSPLVAVEAAVVGGDLQMVALAGGDVAEGGGGGGEEGYGRADAGYDGMMMVRGDDGGDDDGKLVLVDMRCSTPCLGAGVAVRAAVSVVVVEKLVDVPVV